ncbi:MAG: response regulator transcription factor [Tannerella sp.]|jgi:DNA-binding NarL/FixJ family response regulator|nr:response regulator transcription factor [Tannerella sp.]
MKNITILLVDDHEIFRNGVEFLINKEPDMSVIDTAENGLEAIKKVRELKPDIILMDISMPVMSGLEAAEKLNEQTNDSKIIFFSLYDREDYILKSLQSGVKGYILKDAPNETFLKSIRQVAAGNYFYSGDLTNFLVLEYLKKTSSGKQDSSQVKLSNREIEILRKIKYGITNREMALLYNVSNRTIEAHRLNIMRKLGVKNIDAAIEEAIKKEFI